MLLLIIIYLCFIGIGLPAFLLGAAWPSMYESLSVPDSWLGIASMIMMGVTVAANAYSGALAKRFGTGLVMAVSFLMLGAAVVGFAMTHAFVFLCICAVPFGVAVGVIDAVLNNYAATYFKARHMNWLHCGWGVGAAVGPVVLSHGMTRAGTWRWGFFTIGGAQFAIALLLFFTLPLWKKMSKTAVQAKEHVKIQFGALFRLSGVKLSMAAFFFYCSMEMTVGLWGSSYLVMVKDVPAELAARWLSLFFIGITLGRLFGGFLTAQFNNHNLIRLFSVVVAFGIGVMFVSSGELLYMGGFFLTGLGCGPIFPSMMHDTPMHFGEDNSPSVVGLQLASANIGCAVAPFVFGLLAAQISYTLLPLFLVTLLIVMTGIIETLKR